MNRDVYITNTVGKWPAFMAAFYFFATIVFIVETLISFRLTGQDLYTEYRLILLAIYVVGCCSVVPISHLVLFSDIRVPLVFWVAVIALALSLFANGSLPSPLVIAAPLCMYLVFRVLPHFPMHFSPRFIYPLILLAVAPIGFYVFFPEWHDLFLFHDQTFRGLGGSRTDFGYLLGLMAIVFLSFKGWRIFFPIALYGMVLTESRSAVVGLTAAIIVRLWYTRYRYLWLIAGIVGGSGLMLIGLPDLLFKREIGWLDSIRIDLYAEGLSQALNPSNFFFGSGRFYTLLESYLDKTEAHNAVIQSILNFGIFATVGWYLLILGHLRRIAVEGRTFIVFYLVFGMFQVGFDAFFFSPTVLLTFLLAEYFSRRRTIITVKREMRAHISVPLVVAPRQV